VAAIVILIAWCPPCQLLGDSHTNWLMTAMLIAWWRPYRLVDVRHANQLVFTIPIAWCSSCPLIGVYHTNYLMYFMPISLCLLLQWLCEFASTMPKNCLVSTVSTACFYSAN
jgi:hypothetical protein